MGAAAAEVFLESTYQRPSCFGQPPEGRRRKSQCPSLHRALSGSVRCERSMLAAWLWGAQRGSRREGDVLAVLLLDVRVVFTLTSVPSWQSRRSHPPYIALTIPPLCRYNLFHSQAFLLLELAPRCFWRGAHLCYYVPIGRALLAQIRLFGLTCYRTFHPDFSRRLQARTRPAAAPASPEAAGARARSASGPVGKP